MHLLTSGLTGWALVQARNQKRYLRLLFNFALSVSLHDLWNGIAIYVSVFSFGVDNAMAAPDSLLFGLLIGLLVLAFGSIFLLGFNNRKLQAAEAKP